MKIGFLLIAVLLSQIVGAASSDLVESRSKTIEEEFFRRKHPDSADNSIFKPAMDLIIDRLGSPVVENQSYVDLVEPKRRFRVLLTTEKGRVCKGVVTIRFVNTDGTPDLGIDVYCIDEQNSEDRISDEIRKTPAPTKFWVPNGWPPRK